MEKDEKKLLTSVKRATIFSGIGLGLLLGLIMGLSVSETVKIVMGALTAVLGAFLGFDKRSFSGISSEEYQKENQNAHFNALRAGWFGFAVIAGILFGMWVRTHEVFSVPLEKSIKQWTDAGYEPDYARKLVVFQRLAINPQTGEVGAITETQRNQSSSLFSAEQRASLCVKIDPDNFNNDWGTAKEKLSILKNASLNSLLNVIEMNVHEDQRFAFLAGLRYLVCSMQGSNTEINQFGADLSKWQNYDASSRIANEVAKLQPEDQQKIMVALADLVVQLEKN
jgi:uncharacterized membrane protein (Fun14 family)